jgi:hypothetical protein
LLTLLLQLLAELLQLLLGLRLRLQSDQYKEKLDHHRCYRLATASSASGEEMKLCSVFLVAAGSRGLACWFPNCGQFGMGGTVRKCASRRHCYFAPAADTFIDPEPRADFTILKWPFFERDLLMRKRRVKKCRSASVALAGENF